MSLRQNSERRITGKGRGSEKPGQSVGQRVARVEVVLAAGGGDGRPRVGCSALKPVGTVGSLPIDGRVPIQPYFPTPFEGVVSPHKGKVEPRLVEVSVRSQKRAGRGIEGFVQAVTEHQARLRVVDRREEGGAPDVSERRM